MKTEKKTDTQIIKEGIERAREHARKNGIEIGSIVAYGPEGRMMTYELMEKKGDTAVIKGVDLTDRSKKVLNEVPFVELFDANIAKEMAFSIKDELRAKQFPGSSVMRAKGVRIITVKC